jgi:hypothetical protein
VSTHNISCRWLSAAAIHDRIGSGRDRDAARAVRAPFSVTISREVGPWQRRSPPPRAGGWAGPSTTAASWTRSPRTFASRPSNSRAGREAGELARGLPDGLSTHYPVTADVFFKYLLAAGWARSATA